MNHTMGQYRILRGQYAVKLAELERAATELERAERRQRWIRRLCVVGFVVAAFILWELRK